MTSVIVDWISALGNWSWAVLGGILLLVEVLVPGVYLFWFGLAAFAVAIQSIAIPLPWQIQIVFFVLYSGVFIWLARRIQSRTDETSDQPFLNQRAASLVGRSVTIETPIVDGYGRARVDDSIWRVSGPALAAGAHATVVGVDGATLKVARPEEAAPEPRQISD